MVCSTASNSNDVRIPTVPSPTVSRTKEAPGLTAYREEGHPIPRLLTLGAQNHPDQALHPIDGMHQQKENPSNGLPSK